MELDIMFVDIRDGDPVIDDTTLDSIGPASGFLNLAQMLGYTLGPIRNIQEEEVRGQLSGFELFMKKDRAIRKGRFAAYCNYLVDALREYREGSEADPDGIVEIPNVIDVESFDEDVRVLLGGFMLSHDPISGETVASMIPFFGLSLGLFKQFAEHYADERPDVAEAFGLAYEFLKVVSDYCDEAVEKQKILFISA